MKAAALFLAQLAGLLCFLALLCLLWEDSCWPRHPADLLWLLLAVALALARAALFFLALFALARLCLWIAKTMQHPGRH